MIIIIIIGIILIGSAILFGGSNKVRADDELIVAAYSWTTNAGEPESGFDPIQGWHYYAEPLIQSTLLKMNRNMTYRNDLATSYSISDDFKHYYVKLRKDVNFTDGTPLDANDVAFTYNEAKKSGANLDLSNMIKAKKINNYEVEFDLNKSDSSFLNKLAYLGIVPSDSYNNETYGQHPVGSGPYKFVQWNKGQQLILELNDKYYAKKPQFKKLTLIFALNEASFNAAKNREVDIVAVPISYANENISGMSMYLMDSLAVRGISLPVVNNTGRITEDGAHIGNNITSDISIRKALNYGINRKKLAEETLCGFGVPNYDGIAHKLPWTNKNASIIDGNLVKANKTLEEAGWIDNDGDGIREKNATKASFLLYYPNTATEREALAVSVAEQAKLMGIEINATGANWDELDTKKNSEAIVWGFGTSDSSTLWSEFYSDQSGIGYNNPAFVNNSVVDYHIENALKTEGKKSYSELAAASWDGETGISPKGDAPWLWLTELKYGYYVDDRLDISNNTALLQPQGGDIFGNIWDWKIKYKNTAL